MSVRSALYRLLVSAVCALIVMLPAAAATIYPADIGTTPPKIVYSVKKLKSAHSGAALLVYRTATSTQATINFSGDDLDTSTLDTFRAGDDVQVVQWYDQVGSNHVNGSLGSSPKIGGYTVGGTRAVWFDGGSNSGAVYGMATSPALSSLGITAKTYTIMVVVKPSSSIFVNQAGAPDISTGTLAELGHDVDGTAIRVENDSNLAVRGGWSAGDGGAFNYVSDTSMVQTNPVVLAITSGPSGVKVWQNESVRVTASRSALTRTVTELFLGKRKSSSAGATSHCFDGAVLAFMVWDTELGEAERAKVAGALYQRFGIDNVTSRYDAPTVLLFGDSIAAGYKNLSGPQINGYLDKLPALLPYPIRTGNYAIPGNTITQNPAGGPAYANVVGQFPTIAPVITSSVRGAVVIIHGGGNDQGIGPPYRTGNTHSSTLIDGITDTSDLSVGDYVAVSSGLNVVATIASKTANSITLSQPTTTTTTGAGLYFTFAATSPTAVNNGIAGLVTAANTAAARAVIVVNILKRDAPYQPWLDALNVLIEGGSGYTLANCKNYGNLGTNPGVDFSDSAHLSGAGHDDMAACVAPLVKAAFGWP